MSLRKCEHPLVKSPRNLPQTRQVDLLPHRTLGDPDNRKTGNRSLSKSAQTHQITKARTSRGSRPLISKEATQTQSKKSELNLQELLGLEVVMQVTKIPPHRHVSSSNWPLRMFCQRQPRTWSRSALLKFVLSTTPQGSMRGMPLDRSGNVR